MLKKEKVLRRIEHVGDLMAERNDVGSPHTDAMVVQLEKGMSEMLRGASDRDDGRSPVDPTLLKRVQMINKQRTAIPAHYPATPRGLSPRSQTVSLFVYTVARALALPPTTSAPDDSRQLSASMAD